MIVSAGACSAAAAPSHPSSRGNSSTQVAPPPRHNQGSPIGTNLAGVHDYSSEVPFVDLFKTSRPWISGSQDAWSDKRPLDLDGHGWVKSLKHGQVARTLMLWDIDDAFPSGRFTVLYEGQGMFEYRSGARRNRSLSRPGRDVVDFDPSRGGFGLAITSVDPSNYLRNIRVIAPGGVCRQDPYTWCHTDKDCQGGSCELFVDNHETQIFFPPFLKHLRKYSVVRYMDWGQVNDSPLQHWSERPRVDDARWSTDKGVPVEIMVALANRIQADPWFCMPHQADNELVRAYAALVRQHLSPDRRPYVEYSNEVWNGIFSQSRYAKEQGQHLGLGDRPVQAQLKFYAQRATEVLDTWLDVFGKGRLVRVLAGQAANVWSTRVILTHKAAHQKADAFAIAPYFGGYLGTPQELARVGAMTPDALLAELQNVAIPRATQNTKEQLGVARELGLPLIAYEGGQHLAGVHNVRNDKAVNGLFDAVNRDPRMGMLYGQYLAAWKQSGGQLFVHYVNCHRSSKHGRWGARQSLFEPPAQAPKFAALLSFIDANPRWW